MGKGHGLEFSIRHRRVGFFFLNCVNKKRDKKVITTFSSPIAMIIAEKCLKILEMNGGLTLSSFFNRLGFPQIRIWNFI